MTRTALGSAALGVAVALLVVAGCAQPQDATGNQPIRLMDEKQRADEYRAAVRQYPFPLPSGRAFPRTLPAPQEATMFERGEGANQADSFWICAWMGEWLSIRSTDSRGAAVAWAWVEKADQTPLHTERYYDPRDVWHREILEPAKNGDVRSFREFYATSCTFPGLPTPPPVGP